MRHVIRAFRANAGIWAARPSVRYALAVLATLAAAAIRWALEPILAGTSQYDVFFYSVLLAAIVGGMGPGLTALVLGAIAGTLSFAFQGHVGLSWNDDILRLMLFLVFGVFTNLLAGRLLKTRDNARQTAAALLRQARELHLFHFLAEHSNDPFYIISPSADFRFVYVNEAACRHFGWTREHLLTMSIPQFDPLFASDRLPGFWRELKSKGSMRFETRHRCADGSELPVEVSANYFEHEGQELLSGWFHDITGRKAAEEAQAAAGRMADQARAAAEEASRAKDHFLAVLSHELRTPLTPVLSTALLLESDENLPRRYRDDVGIIRRNVELEARLIDDLLDVNRIVRGKVKLDRKSVPLGLVIRRAIEVCQCDIEARHLHFRLDCGDAAGCLVYADAARLQQVFWNVLKNAIKFTPQGGSIAVRCNRAGPGKVVIEVADTGAGIEPQMLPRIFNAFEQGGSQVTRQFGGLGLGLTITKGLVEMHGGSISAHSDGRGKGATFRICLPLSLSADRAADTQPGEAPPASPPRSLRILLVEDHGDTARVMKRLLMADGHDVETAGDVATALDLAGSRSFDLLISDLGLPDGNGTDLMRTLRQRGYTLPGIALSGYGQEQDIQRSRDAGFAVHLVKPTGSNRLTEAIAAVARHPGAD